MKQMKNTFVLSLALMLTTISTKNRMYKTFRVDWYNKSFKVLNITPAPKNRVCLWIDGQCKTVDPYYIEIQN